MSDYCIWNPRLGTTGDDIYNIPGGTKLDGTKDNTNPSTLIIAGNYFPYALDPTVAQLQAADSLGINQILGVLNHFCQQKSLSNIAYTSKNAPIIWNLLHSAKVQIDAVRAAYGMTAFPWSSIWTSSPTAGVRSPILGSHFAELRKALNISISVQAWDLVAIGACIQQYVQSGGVWVPGTYSGPLSGGTGVVAIRSGNGTSLPGFVTRILFMSKTVTSIEAGRSLYFTLTANLSVISPTGTTPAMPNFSMGYYSPNPVSNTSLAVASGGTLIASGVPPVAGTYGPYLITNSMVLGQTYTIWFSFDGDVAFQNATAFGGTREWDFGENSSALNGYFTYQ